MKKKIASSISILLLMASVCSFVFAEESTLEKAETTKNKTLDEVKGAYRKTDDMVCEKLNGKSNCVAKKLKNKVKNAADRAKTDATEVINKVD